jgi:hypothetical protein
VKRRPGLRLAGAFDGFEVARGFCWGVGFWAASPRARRAVRDRGRGAGPTRAHGGPLVRTAGSPFLIELGRTASPGGGPGRVGQRRRASRLRLEPGADVSVYAARARADPRRERAHRGGDRDARASTGPTPSPPPTGRSNVRPVPLLRASCCASRSGGGRGGATRAARASFESGRSSLERRGGAGRPSPPRSPAPPGSGGWTCPSLLRQGQRSMPRSTSKDDPTAPTTAVLRLSPAS